MYLVKLPKGTLVGNAPGMEQLLSGNQKKT